MAENNLDALLLTGGTSMVYFCGMNWGTSERLTCAIIPAKGSAFIITPTFEEERTLAQARLGPLGAETSFARAASYSSTAGARSRDTAPTFRGRSCWERPLTE
jgi:Xaa-Pro aminopeptidase